MESAALGARIFTPKNPNGINERLSISRILGANSDDFPRFFPVSADLPGHAAEF
jgi:hypothetical protein